MLTSNGDNPILTNSPGFPNPDVEAAGIGARAAPRRGDWLASQAERNPHRLALSDDGRQWDFAALHHDVTRLAGYLWARGIRPGDRVALRLPAGANAIRLTLASIRIGAVIVPVNLRLSEEELEAILMDADPALVVGSDGGRTSSSRSIIPMAEFLATKPAAVVPGDPDPDRVAALVYTSGTTGRPKGVELTLSNIWWSAVSSARYLGTLGADRWLLLLPLFHTSGLSIVFRGVILGHGVVVQPRFEPASALGALERQRITLVSVVPTMLRRLLEVSEGPPPASLRLVLVGGAGAPPSLLQAAADRKWPVSPTYGLTETASQVATLRPDDFRRQRTSAGRVIPPTRIAIAVNGHPNPAPETVGEIWIKGPTVSPGYWRDPRRTAATFSDGWLKTGDIGMMGADGYLTVLDRAKDLIITGGENVYPHEVESALAATGLVQDAGVFAEPDPVWGERIAAAIVAARPSGPHQLYSALAPHLARYKWPKAFYLVPAIPRTPSGKVKRHLLPELVRRDGRILGEGQA
ncbi:MAG: o-succinylbenzoate--CoA ligase [Thermaerobacter sp.]|nr:o-succinylbenzoate--CoA ligase [Thermaerobacter sp.]